MDCITYTRTFFNVTKGTPQVSLVDIVQEVKGGSTTHYLTLKNGYSEIVISSENLDVFEEMLTKLHSYLYKQREESN